MILDIVLETMPRDNLLNSACLELFEFIKRENIKPFIVHVVEKYRDKLEQITYVDTFQSLTMRFEQLQGYSAEAEADSALFSQEEGSTPRRMPLNGQRWQGVKGLDVDEERYFETADDDDEDEWTQEDRSSLAVGTPNGSTPLMLKPLVDYPDDDDDEDAMDTNKTDSLANPAEGDPLNLPDVEAEASSEADATPPSPAQTPPVPERLTEKRRRDEEDEDELGKLAAGPKRRSSTSSNSSAGILNRKKNLSIGSDKGTAALGGNASAAPKRIAINLGPAKSSVSEDDKSCTEVSNDGNEKENRDDSQGNEDG